MRKKPLLISGSSHPHLAEELASQLNISLGKRSISQFPDGETQVEILEDVAQKSIYVIQTIAFEPNHYLVELLLIIDALKRGLADTITVIIPYLGYSRQDRTNQKIVPISAKLLADLLVQAGANHLITCDLHSDQVEGFFNIPVTHLHCYPLVHAHLKHQIIPNLTLVSPDLGSVKMVEKMAKLFNVEMVIINKERIDPSSVTMSLIGNVKNKTVLIVDDMSSTAETIIKAAKLCQEHGATNILVSVTHGLFVQGALKKLENSCVEKIICTNTVNLKSAPCKRLEIITVAPLIADVIRDQFK